MKIAVICAAVVVVALVVAVVVVSALASSGVGSRAVRTGSDVALPISPFGGLGLAGGLGLGLWRGGRKRPRRKGRG